MNHFILPIVTLLYMVIVGSHASTTPETYWKNVLPNTPMPLSYQKLIASSRVNGLCKQREPRFCGDKSKPKPIQVLVWRLLESSTQTHVDPTRVLFFLEKDMKVGSHMTFQFIKNLNGATFLTREEANTLLFSSDEMSAILQQFSLKPDSKEAQIVKKTIKVCETKANQGEEKYCATSLESMVEFATFTIGGNNIKALSTVVHNNNNQVEKYTITEIKKTAGENNKNTVCHKLDYAYAVYYCHKTNTATSSYVVSLVGSNGSSVKGVAICHKDTSDWNPKHVAFQVLIAKPGTVPICHFLTDENIMWVPNN